MLYRDGLKYFPRFCEYEVKNCVALAAAGRMTQLSHFIFMEPGNRTFAHPCIRMQVKAPAETFVTKKVCTKLMT